MADFIIALVVAFGVVIMLALTPKPLIFAIEKQGAWVNISRCRLDLLCWTHRSLSAWTRHWHCRGDGRYLKHNFQVFSIWREILSIDVFLPVGSLLVYWERCFILGCQAWESLECAIRTKWIVGFSESQSEDRDDEIDVLTRGWTCQMWFKVWKVRGKTNVLNVVFFFFFIIIIKISKKGEAHFCGRR